MHQLGVMESMVRHIKAVREMDPYLKHAVALIVYENNHADSETHSFETFFAREDIKAQIRPFETLNTEKALKTLGKPSQIGRRVRETDDPLVSALTAAPADQEGRVRPGARTTKKNKPIACDLLKRCTDARKLFFHARLLAVLSPENEELEEFAEVLAGEDETELRRLLGLDQGGSAGGAMPTLRDRLGPTYESRTRQRMLKTFEHQLRNFRAIVHERVDPYGETKRHIEYSGKKFDGPHFKKDDLVSSTIQLVYTMSLVCILDAFRGVRVLIGMG
jgi:hypothetical protein